MADCATRRRGARGCDGRRRHRGDDALSGYTEETRGRALPDYQRRLVKQLERMGYDVALSPKAA
jgi:hypothetical protein